MNKFEATPPKLMLSSLTDSQILIWNKIISLRHLFQFLSMNCFGKKRKKCTCTFLKEYIDFFFYEHIMTWKEMLVFQVHYVLFFYLISMIIAVMFKNIAKVWWIHVHSKMILISGSIKIERMATKLHICLPCFLSSGN